MPSPKPQAGPFFTVAAREAALAAKKAKREGPDTFGLPELFIVKADGLTFTWELRRFGGMLLQRGSEAFPSQALARAEGEAALAILCASPDLPKSKRQDRCRIEPAEVRREAENADPDPLDAAAELEALRSRMVRLARLTQR